MIPVLMYKSARNEILSWPLEVKKDLGSVLTKLQKGESVGYPDVDSMRTVGSGCFEVCIKGGDGIYRAFCVIKTEYGIIVFHSFKKKSQKTPQKEIETAKKRLNMFLKELENEK
jgi:phage-related protein